MEIRGSESDITVWNPKPFPIGNTFWLPNKNNKKTTINYEKKISVKVPLRLSPIMLDLTRFVPTGINVREYGAGEVSIAVNSYLSVILSLNKNNDSKINGTDKESVVRHAIELYKKAIGEDFGVDIKVEVDNNLSHVGLGTTPAHISAIILGINSLCDNYFDNRELSRLITLNYGEEFSGDKNMLVPGISTGGAFWSCIFGGINVTSGDFSNVFSSKLNTDLDLIVSIPITKEKQWAEKGFEIPIMDLVRKYDRFDAGKICHWVLMRLMPAILDNDVKKIGEVFWDVTLNTSKAIPPIIKHGVFSTFDLLAELYVNNVEGAFLSSAGPLIGCFSMENGKTKLIESLFDKYSIPYKIMKIDNKGIEINKISD